ncbi:1-phosphatidylinositol 4,5-bisphosphate phosphodiesterase zeta-1 [Eurytemora carolleeae]|uniref:1-phosphatidylinositol 4,5-bisphosphate phosphodiesterase zeta-1 n=1 Tax=Eurytemora carolleeae TaxID=1294199 RepID=UPI000C7603CA|nr:1-phosphatidylinositol 4,5-bisphosphate phosphodiesterase zeta-1 [Eurytemora carolleeae]|eukprot:XP_023329052.1 1-phosphatidylinositol 4,5-bisphosphate phosphodiesterase zeta-1-like [Eurytemora affinis]
MANLMKEILGDMLYTDPVDKNRTMLPSPEDLKFKILVKAKKIRLTATGSIDEEPEVLTKSALQKLSNKKGPVRPHRKTSAKAKLFSARDLDISNEPYGPQSSKVDEKDSSSKTKTEIGSKDDPLTKDKGPTVGRCSISNETLVTNSTQSRLLSDIVNYCEASKFKDFEEERNYWEMSSFDESKTEQFCTSDSTALKFVEYNKRNLSRIYPRGTRLLSSNLDPILPWVSGCQMVALNFQQADTYNLYNRAMFQQNGGCGYVLKPEFLRIPASASASTSALDSSSAADSISASGSESVSHNIPASVSPGASSSLSSSSYSPLRIEKNINLKCVKLTIRLISGQHLPNPSDRQAGDIIEPFVRIKIVGHPQDCCEWNSKTVPRNGFNPIWDEQTTFNLLVPDLAIIYFKVKSKTKLVDTLDDYLGSYAVAFNLLRKGYRLDLV